MSILKRNPKPYTAERDRLLKIIKTEDPTTDEYQVILARINELDKILNRTTELKKTVIPAAGTIVGVIGIYGLQQFFGIIIPKALDSIAARSNKSHKDHD